MSQPRDPSQPPRPAPQAGSVSAVSPGRARVRGGMDAATLLGLAAAVSVVLIAIASGGSLRAFLDPPSLLIVLGGTVAVTTASFSLPDMVTAGRDAGRVLVQQTHDPRAVGRQMMLVAETARRAGPEILRSMLADVRGEAFLHRCLTLVTEGLPHDEVERMLIGEVDANAAGRLKSASVLRRASEVAPAMGLIGTLVGLVQMLGSLNDPAAIGPSMALALLTTFYGAVFGNILLAPLAAKLERNAEEDALVRTLYTIGAVSIARQENPRRLEMQLNTVLPPGRRIQYFDRESPRGA